MEMERQGQLIPAAEAAGPVPIPGPDFMLPEAAEVQA